MATYHVTGIFLLEDPAHATTEVITSALHGTIGIDAAVVVTGTDLEPALEKNLRRLFDAAGVEPHIVVRNTDQSLAAQLAQPLARITSDQPADRSWLWFLTPGTEVAPDALEKQLQAIEISPSVAIAGAKQRTDRYLINVGLTVAHNGDVLNMIEPGELDQGQYDHRTDTFAVATPGMLIKHQVFTALDGFDELSPQSVRDVDLCWRARLAGHRVAVVPRAVVQHDAAPAEHEDWRTGLVESTSAARWLRLKHASLPSMIGAWLWGVLAALGALLGGLFVKDPATGVARGTGNLKTLGRIGPLITARRAAARTRTRPFDAVNELRPSRASVRDYRRSVIEIVEPDRVIGDGTGVSVAPQQATGGHDDFDELATPDRNWIGAGAVTLGVVFGAVALLGLRQLLGVPALAGGNLLPVTQDLPTLITKAISGWSLTGAGAPGYDGPFGWLLVLFGLTGNASAAIVWLWVLALPLAGLGAWALASAVTSARYVRFAAGILWAGAPVLLTALSEGRLGGLVVHLVLPWFLLALLRAIGYRPDDIKLFRALTEDRKTPEPVKLGSALREGTATTSLTAAAWAAILLTVITAAAPSLLPVLILGIIVLILWRRATAKVLWWTPLLALSTLLPAILTHRTDLRAILADPGAPAGFDPAPTWQLLLGLPHHRALDAGVAELPWLDALLPGLPWAGIIAVVIALPLIVLALIGALAPSRGGGLARIGLLIAVVGLLQGTLNAGIIFAIDQTGTPVALSTIPAVSLTWLGLLTAAMIGINYLTVPKSELRVTLASIRVRAGWPARTATTLVVVSGVLATGLWLTPRVTPAETLQQARNAAITDRSVAVTEAATDSTVTNPQAAGLAPLTGAGSVAGVVQRSLPATALDAAISELQTRTLVITRTTEGIRTHLISGEGTMLDDMTGTWTSRSVTGGLLDPQPAPADDADNALRTLAAQLTSAADADPRPALNALGAGYVVLTDPQGTETTLAASIDAAPGLAPVGHSRAGWLWRVSPATDLTATDTDNDTATDHAPVGAEVVTDQGPTPPRGTDTARARIIENGQTTAIVASQPNGSIAVQLPAGSGDRQLVIAERANPGFRAYLDGQELNATVTDPDWVQAFELPAKGGQLTMSYDPPAGTWLWMIPGVLGLVVLLVGIPTPMRVRTRKNS